MIKRMQARHLSICLGAVAMVLAARTSVTAEQPRKPDRPAKPAIETTNPGSSEVSAPPAVGDGFCTAVRAQAAVDQAALDKAELQRFASELDARVKDLERTIADAQQWLAKRDAFAARARDSVVQIYAKMQPEAAAVQLAAMGEEIAAAVLLRLDAKLASMLMAEMESGKAARLASLLVHAGDVPAASKAAAATRPAARPGDEVRR